MDRMAYFSFWPMFLRRMCKAFFASQRVVTFDLVINNFIVINALTNARYRKLPLMTLALAVDEFVVLSETRPEFCSNHEPCILLFYLSGIFSFYTVFSHLLVVFNEIKTSLLLKSDRALFSVFT